MSGRDDIGGSVEGTDLTPGEGAKVMGDHGDELEHAGREASSVPRDANRRELSVDELDVEDMVGNMAFRLGAAWMAVGGRPTGLEEKLRGMLWELMPFAKALGALALENPGRMRELWAQALQEPMPFGGAPLGMPTVEVKRIACPIHGAFEPTQEGACPDCWRSEQIRRGAP
jgi:hypothetical protein